MRSSAIRRRRGMRPQPAPSKFSTGCARRWITGRWRRWQFPEARRLAGCSRSSRTPVSSGSACICSGWTNARCRPTDAQSNFKFAQDAWLRPGNFPAPNIHRVLAELDPPDAAARYVEDIQQFFGLAAGELPHFDVMHRGMGPDAHTASLFPGEPLIENRSGIAAAVWVEKFKQWRITLLPGVLLAARHTALLVAGADKTAALRSVLQRAVRSAALSGADRFRPRAPSGLWMRRRRRTPTNTNPPPIRAALEASGVGVASPSSKSLIWKGDPPREQDRRIISVSGALLMIPKNCTDPPPLREDDVVIRGGHVVIAEFCPRYGIYGAVADV